MPKKRSFRTRLRPHMDAIRRKITAEYDEEIYKLRAIIKQREAQLETAGQALIDKDKGRSLMDHLKSWWANRNA
jgi:hypothetical protein